MGLDKKKDEVKGEFIRIQKYISDCGIMSRRAAEHEIRLATLKLTEFARRLEEKSIRFPI